MKRIAVIADSHFDEHSRFEECIRLHSWIEQDIAKRGVDLILHAGDVFERKSTPAERNAVATWLQSLARHAPVLIVRGNHDVVGDLQIFGELETKHPILVEEAAGVHELAGVAVAALAWPRKAELLARLGDRGVEAGEQAAGDALRAVLRGLGQGLEGFDGPRVLLTHAMVRGSVTSTGQPLVGCDMEIGLEDLALVGADFVALGHIHKGQEWTHDETAMVYPGSPRRTAFGEIEEKGYVVADLDRVDGEVEWTWERVVVPATPMLLIEADWCPAEVLEGARPLVITSKTFPTPERVQSAEVRLRYRTPSDARDAARDVAELLREQMLRDGAIAVKLEEEVIPSTKARAPEIARAVTLIDKLGLVWDRKNVPTERRERLRAKLAEIESEA